MLKSICKSLVLIGLLYSCSDANSEMVQYLDVPFELNASEPNIHKSKSDDLYLSWIEYDKDSISHLKFSTLENGNWSEAKSIAKGKDWFVNWADFPSITSFGNDNLAAHFLDKSASDTYAYDVKLITSNNNGDTWNDAFIPHHDGTNTEHGFVSKLALKDDSFLAVWLDGRQNAYAELDSTIAKQMTLRSGTFDAKGNSLTASLLDDRVCDCCQTDAAMTAEGPIVVYRNRSENEERDTYFLKNVNGKWSQPKAISDDNWVIAGCPVNGPAVATHDNAVVAVWFTMANNKSQVKLAFSKDNGNTFDKSITIDDTNPLGRLDVEMLNDNSAIISWMDTNSIGEGVIKLQRIFQDGRITKPYELSGSSKSRSSGFPRMVLKDDLIYLTWTHVGTPLSIKSAILNTKALN